MRVFIKLLITFIILLISIMYLYFHNYEENISELLLIDNLKVEYASKTKVSDFIKDQDISLVDDFIVDTTILGLKEVSFYYYYNNRKIKQKFTIEIVDTTAPVIILGTSYKVKKGYQKNLTDVIVCGDNYDNNPTCEIEGNYDLNIVGEYSLKYNATDINNNKTTNDFILKVVEETPSNNSSKTYLSDTIDLYKTSSTSIGIDVSEWQGNINWSKVKASGVEFVMIRIGFQKGYEGDLFIDDCFYDNIEGATKAGLQVGIYLYSYAKTTIEAKSQANWVIDKLGEYELSLPIAFDWENWSTFNSLNLSYYDLNSIAGSFLQEVEDKGYFGMLYGSATYLNRIWFKSDYKTWLAHYTSKTSYAGDYMMWQKCNDGKVDGINGYVDLNIMYK